MRHFWWFQLLVTLALACLGAVSVNCVAWAQNTENDSSEVARARDYFRAGAQAYSVGAYAAAVQAFEQAYQLAPRPAVLFSIAQAEKRLFYLSRDRTHLEKAVQLYRAYLSEDPQATRRLDASQALAELEPLLISAAASTKSPSADELVPQPAPALPTRLMIASPAEGARISLDGAAAEPSPLIREVNPGEHVARVEAPGYVPDERRIVAVEGSLVTFDVSLTEQPARLKITAASGAELIIDGRLQGTFPFPKPLELSAGRHLIAVTKRGHEPWSEERNLKRGETVSLRVRQPRTIQRTTALILFGAAASAVTAGGIFGYFALGQESSAEGFLDQRGRTNLTPGDLAEYESVRKDRDNLRLAAAISLGSGLALAATGAVLFSLDAKQPQPLQKTLARRRLPAPTPKPLVGTDTFGLFIEQRF